MDVGPFQVRSLWEGGLIQAERAVDLLTELAFVGAFRGRLDHQGHGYVVRVGILVSGPGSKSGSLSFTYERGFSGGGAFLRLARTAFWKRGSLV